MLVLECCPSNCLEVHALADTKTVRLDYTSLNSGLERSRIYIIASYQMFVILTKR